MAEKPILMIPGPTEIPWRIIRSMMQPSMAHYDPEFNVGVLDATLLELRKVFQTKNEIVALPGSGRSGVEAAITSVIEPGDGVLSIVCGVFGRWMKEIAERIGGEAVEFSVDWGQPIDLVKLEAELSERKFKALTVVHNESSTGAMYPIAEIGQIARRYDALYIVDAVSSLGGANIETDRWGVDCLTTASQKCLCAPIGLAMVSISPKAWEAMERRKKPATSFSYDLLKWKKWWIPKERGGEDVFGTRRQPFTMPVHLVYALREATAMILEEGLENRFRRHRIAAKAVREGVKALGLQLFADEKVASDTITAVRNPSGMADADIRKLMLEKHGVMIAGGLEQQAGKMFRIGHMGMTASPEYVLPTLLALERSLARLGLKFEPGKAVGTAAAFLDDVS